MAAAGLALLFGFTSYADLLARGSASHFSFFGQLVVVPLTPARYQGLRLGLGVGALGAGLLLGLLPGPGRRPAAGRRGGLGRDELRRRGRGLVRPGQRLGPAERGLAVGLLLAAAAARLYYAGYYPLSLDEIGSYDYWVLPGAAVTASYYPFPNNHILPNLLVGLVRGLLPGASPELALRLLPTLLSLLSLPILYALFLRYAWLRAQPLRRVWVEPRTYAVFWQHYALSAGQRPLPLWVVADVPAARPGAPGEVEALPAGWPGPDSPGGYRNELLRIIPVSPTQPLRQK